MDLVWKWDMMNLSQLAPVLCRQGIKNIIRCTYPALATAVTCENWVIKFRACLTLERALHLEEPGAFLPVMRFRDWSRTWARSRFLQV